MGPGLVRRAVAGRRMALEQATEGVFVPAWSSVVAINRYVVAGHGFAPMNGPRSSRRSSGSLNFKTYKSQ